ncbi:fibronectin type III domain-containing protein [Chloroflexota bacterium]
MKQLTVVLLAVVLILSACRSTPPTDDNGNGDSIDTTPPVLTSVSASDISGIGATITWTTNEAATSQLEYGVTTDYGTTTTLDTTFSTNHSLNLSGLTLGTTYHYRVKSVDGSDNQAVSEDYTFETTYTLSEDELASLLVEIIRDNIDGEFTISTFNVDIFYASLQIYYNITFMNDLGIPALFVGVELIVEMEAEVLVTEEGMLSIVAPDISFLDLPDGAFIGENGTWLSNTASMLMSALESSGTELSSTLLPDNVITDLILGNDYMTVQCNDH